MSELIRTGGGTFDPADRNVYFIASGSSRLELTAGHHDHMLIAVNEITPADFPELDRWVENGVKLFIDSGIFNLTNEHKRKHDISMDEALALAPNEIDGFDALFDRYVEVVKRYESSCWGYIELDQGGMDNKIKTRAILEGMGLRPIPVYHPFNDGWDYFDYLAERYDRICFGNVVQANAPTRKRLAATAWERKQKYPELWIHFLGMTPNPVLNAYPVDSADSSSWLVSMRWSASWRSFAMQKTFSDFPLDMRYQLGESKGPGGADKAVAASAYQYNMLSRNWFNYVRRGEELGFFG